MIPSISFIIPALNESMRIKSCIEALKSIDSPKEIYEIIVVDNGSDDKTALYAIESGAKVIYASPKNRAVARNAGVKASRGDVLCFIDADCLVTKDWLNRVIEALKDAKISAVQSLIIPTFIQRDVTYRSYPLEHIGVPFLDTKACAMRRDVFDQIKGFDQRFNRCEDIDISWKLNSLGCQILYPNNIVAYGGIPESIAAVIKRSRETAGALKMLYKKWGVRTEIKYIAPKYYDIAVRLFAIRRHNTSLYHWLLWILGDIVTFTFQRVSYLPDAFAPPINLSISFFNRLASEVLILRASLLRFVRLFS